MLIHRIHFFLCEFGFLGQLLVFTCIVLLFAALLMVAAVGERIM